MRTPEDDAHLGRTVLERGLVAREALLECLFQMTLERKAGVPRPLGVLLVSRGCLSEDDLNSILASRVSAAGAAGTLPEAEVGRLLVATGDGGNRVTAALPQAGPFVDLSECDIVAMAWPAQSTLCFPSRS